MIGVILAKSRELALTAADKVNITYDVLKPIVTIDEAIEAKSFFPIFGPRIKACQNIQDDLDNSDHVISGKCFFLFDRGEYSSQRSVIVP